VASTVDAMDYHRTPTVSDDSTFEVEFLLNNIMT
jgi:hypothetical protein